MLGVSKEKRAIRIKVCIPLTELIRNLTQVKQITKRKQRRTNMSDNKKVPMKPIKSLNGIDRELWCVAEMSLDDMSVGATYGDTLEKSISIFNEVDIASKKAVKILFGVQVSKGTLEEDVSQLVDDAALEICLDYKELKAIYKSDVLLEINWH